MTELEVLRRAKTYIDALANGIDPLSGLPVPDGELIHNVRISRCLFYVSDVLRQVLENGGTVGRTARPSKAPFSLDPAQRALCAPSDTPLPVTGIAGKINGLIPEIRDGSMKKLNYRSITAFLMEAGLLTEIEDAAGKKAKRPTGAGRSMGISTEERVSPEGHPYTAVLYDRGAQQFLMDHMDAIIEIDRLTRAEREERLSHESGDRTVHEDESGPTS